MKQENHDKSTGDEVRNGHDMHLDARAKRRVKQREFGVRQDAEIDTESKIL